MNFVVTLDWKFAVALGVAVSGVIFSVKMSPEAAEKVSIHAVDAFKEFAVAGNGNH